MNLFWDSPMVSGMAFNKRQCACPGRRSSSARDGSLEVENGISLGYTFYPCNNPQACVVYFHANAEIVTDLDGIAPAWVSLGLAVLAFDYRGYGWSTGQPNISNFLGDCERIAQRLPGLLSELDSSITGLPLIVFGRSIGACAALHTVTYQQMANIEPRLKFSGLILDSGLMELKSMPMVQQLSGIVPNGAQMLGVLPDPFNSYAKVPSVECGVLIMHSEADEVVPYSQAQKAFSLLVCEKKQIKAFRGTGHNDIFSRHQAEYFALVKAFVGRCLLAPLGTREELQALPAKELKRLIEAHGLSAVGLFEKTELVDRLLQGSNAT